MRILDVGWGRGGFDPVALSPDGSLLATGHLYRVVVWEVRTGRQLVTVRPGILGTPDGLAFTSDGCHLAIGDARNCFLYEVVRSQSRVRLVPRGQTVSRRSRGFWSLFSPQQSSAMRTYSIEGMTIHWSSMRFWPESQLLLVHGQYLAGFSGPISANLSLPSPDLLVRYPTHRDASLLRFSPRGDRFAAFTVNSVVLLSQLDIEPGDPRDFNVHHHIIATFDCKGTCNGLGFSDDGTTLVGFGGQAARVWDIVNMRERVQLESSDSDWSAGTLSANGEKLLLAAGSELRLFDARTAELLDRYDFRIGPITTTVFAPDGLTAMAGGQEGKLVIWDLE